MALMAAETLGIDYHLIQSGVVDTETVPYCHVTGGSRVTYATGLAVIDACRKVIDDMRARAALIRDVDVDAVVWEDGCAKPAGSNAGDFEPLPLKEIAAKFSATGGPIGATGTVSAGGQAPGFSTQFCDVEVDPETGRVTIPALRGRTGRRARDPPELRRGPDPGRCGAGDRVGAQRGVRLRRGRQDEQSGLPRLPRTGGLGRPDDRADRRGGAESEPSYGVKGVGEVSICPPMAAVANAVADAIGRRMQELPMSPPKVLEALDHRHGPEL